MKFKFYIIILTIIFFSSCSLAIRALAPGHLNASVEVLYHKLKPKIYTIGKIYFRKTAKTQEDYPNAPDIIREAFENEFIKTGFRVTESLKTEAIEHEEERRRAFHGKGPDLKKKVIASGIISITINDYYQGSFSGGYTTVGFSVQASMEDGQILWSAIHNKSAVYDYKADPSIFAQIVAKEIVQELIKKGVKR
jgi:hypothetical protein